MVKRYFRLAVAAFVCLLPARVWSAVAQHEGTGMRLPWANHGDHLQIEANPISSLSTVPASPHSVPHRSSHRFVETVGVVVAATTVLFLVFRWSSLRRRRAISKQFSEDGSPLPRSDVEPFEWQTGEFATADVEFRSASGVDEEGDVVELQIQILTLSADDASTLSPAEKRMVAMALESIQFVGDELDVLHAKATEIDIKISGVQDEIEQVTEDYGAPQDYRTDVVEALQKEVERLEEQSDIAWGMYEEKSRQRDQMGYAAVQEQRSARLLSDSASRSSRDGTPPLTRRAAAAVAAAERVLQVVRRHSPFPVNPRPSSLSQQAGMAEKNARVHTRALAQIMQQWDGDPTALVAAAEEALVEANAVLGQLGAGSMNEASSSLKAAISKLEEFTSAARKIKPVSKSIRSVATKETPEAAKAVARVKEQSMLALRVSRDLGKMQRSMDGTEEHFRKMEALFGDGVAILTVAMHTDVPPEVPHEVYEPFQLSLQMCKKVLNDVAAVLQPRWLAEIERQKDWLRRTADALSGTRMQATASGHTGINELLESDMRQCRCALNDAKTLYKSMMALTAFRPVAPFLANNCVGLRLAMDAAQTQLVQAADTLASAWEAELKEAIESFKLHADDDAAEHLSSRADEGDEALARIYRLADPSPQFEELETALERAKHLVAEFEQQHQQKQKQAGREKQEDTTGVGVVSRFRQWLRGERSGQK